jgi:glycosyltransferase involved in cell wall biosynthesis
MMRTERYLLERPDTENNIAQYNLFRFKKAVLNYNIPVKKLNLPEILVITSYPPRECGIATYSQDLIKVLNNKFGQSFKISLCPLESENEIHNYPDPIKFILNTDREDSFIKLRNKINENTDIKMIIIQHEFGFFSKTEAKFLKLIQTILKPVIVVFHTVLPNADEALKVNVKKIAEAAESIIVMTRSSAKILTEEYGINPDKIAVIPHGTHLVPQVDAALLKSKYNLQGKKVISTFGLLSSGKSIETTLYALPEMIKRNPDIIFLIIGKTHPSVVKKEGEWYREMLFSIIESLDLQKHVRFVNQFLPLPELLEYLQLTDVYLFTSKDRNQAVSGTFSYAISSGCPIISTPIPHAVEVLGNDAGIIFDFENPDQLAEAVNSLMDDDELRTRISSNGLHRMAATAWENSAISHALIFEKMSYEKLELHYTLPELNLSHIKNMTTDFGMIQFSKLNHPDLESGYTLDDNARAMIALCQHFEMFGDKTDIPYIQIYLKFIGFCLQEKGNFLNYVNTDKVFTEQNDSTNLSDANGRAIWALGYLISLNEILPAEITDEAELIIQKALPNTFKTHSTRSMGFIIKGLYYRNSGKDLALIIELADRLVQMFRHESNEDWLWFESYLTYANSILPEAMLCAWLATGKTVYKDIAKSTFDFLLEKTFNRDIIKVISNITWLQKGENQPAIHAGGEQPIDVAYTIIALSKFYRHFKEISYRRKMESAFSWFQGNNHLNQIVYNPCTGGCYDGIELNNVNLNQGAESTVSYLMARLTLGKQNF